MKLFFFYVFINVQRLIISQRALTRIKKFLDYVIRLPASKSGLDVSKRNGEKKKNFFVARLYGFKNQSSKYAFDSTVPVEPAGVFPVAQSTLTTHS